ncbi:hypothetical protein L1987_24830 [Smallanthus sonchifolius]|uniref:Uncharacterized protein n=1 Tax=Smallanthus sonchifolius TaxID=185202 RepID=A0ACB9ILB2_9ASTR|nr:hypothetical protein L1987_24830 [Smallanthus sonchifolius]
MSYMSRIFMTAGVAIDNSHTDQGHKLSKVKRRSPPQIPAPVQPISGVLGSDVGGLLDAEERRTQTDDSLLQVMIYVGYDPREDVAYEVCRYSILKRSSIPVEIIPIKQSELREKNYYWVERGKLESTEFSFTRFLTSFLAGYEGWAMFVDCGFLYLGDIKELFDLVGLGVGG